MQLKLIDNKCWTPTICETTLWVKPLKEDYDIRKDALWEFYNVNDRSVPIISYSFDVLMPFYYNETHSDKCSTSVLETLKNGSKVEETTCSYKTVTKVKNQWTTLRSALEKDKGYLIKMKVIRQPNKLIDWIPTIYNQKLDAWSWYNSSKASRINITGLDRYIPLALNGTSDIDLNGTSAQVYCNGDSNTAVYFDSGATNIVCANKTDVFYTVVTSPATYTVGTNSQIGLFLPLDNAGTFAIDYSQNSYNYSYNGLGGDTGYIFGGVTFDGTNCLNKSGAQVFDGDYGSFVEFMQPTFHSGEDILSPNNQVWFNGDGNGNGHLYNSIKASGGKAISTYLDNTQIVHIDIDYLYNTTQNTMLGLTYNTTNDQTRNYVNSWFRTDSTVWAGSEVNNGYIGCLETGTYPLDAGVNISHVVFYEMVLTPEQMNTSYNMATSMGELEGAPAPSGAFTVTLHEPENIYNSSTGVLDFNCSAESSTDDLTNLTLQIWNSSGSLFTSQLDTVTGSSNESYFSSIGTFYDDTFVWNCRAENDLPNSTVAATNNTFQVDTTNPTVRIDSPLSKTYNSSNTSIEFSPKDSGGVGVESCWYSYDSGSTNTSLSSCANNSYFSGTNIYTLWVWANDSVGNEGSDSVIYGYYNVSFINYTTPVVESDYSYYYLTLRGNFTYNSIVSAQNYTIPVLKINGTSITGTYFAGNSVERIYRAGFSIPYNSTDSTYTFNWNWTLVNSTVFEGDAFMSDTNQQNVSAISIYTCPYNETNTSISVTSYYEENRAAVNSTLDYILSIWKSNPNNKKTINGTSAEAEAHYFCLAPVDSSLQIDALFEYELSPYVVRRYIMNNATITNSSTDVDIYQMNDSLDTIFLFTIQDDSYSPVENWTIRASRHYPDINSYLVVEMDNTDALGQVVLHLNKEDGYYQIEVYDYDQLQKIFSAFKPVCKGGECEYTLTVLEEFSEYSITPDGVNYNVTYNNNTKQIRYQFSDSAGTSREARLLVHKLGGTSNTKVCDTTVSSTGGEIICDFTGNGTGTYLYQAYIDGDVIRSSSVDDKTDYLTFGTEGVFWAVILVVFISLFGITFAPPIVAMMLPVVMLFGLTVFQIISIPIAVLVEIAILIIFAVVKFRS